MFESNHKPAIEIVVVDNDGAKTAQAVCSEFTKASACPVRYVTEPRRGLSYVRNKAVIEALDECDFIAFIDDDEVPDVNWLQELLQVQAQCDADVVCGPVLPHFMGEVPQWIVKGCFFDRERHRTGTVLRNGRTGNVLIRSSVFRKVGLFDDRFAMSGGEDEHFFRRVADANCRIVWADNATVHEWIPTSRMTAGWLLKRAFRTGNTHVIATIACHGYGWLAMRNVLGALAKILSGAVFFVPSVLQGKQQVFKNIQQIVRGFGILIGFASLRVEEYRTIHKV